MVSANFTCAGADAGLDIAVDGMSRFWPEPPSDTLDPYYFSTAIISLIASAFVVVSFVKFKQLRQHPSTYDHVLANLLKRTTFIALFISCHCGVRIIASCFVNH